MSRLALVLSLLLLAALPATADAKVRKSPSRCSILHASRALSSTASHGSLIWARKLTGKAALKGGTSNRLLLYRSEGREWEEERGGVRDAGDPEGARAEGRARR